MHKKLILLIISVFLLCGFSTTNLNKAIKVNESSISVSSNKHQKEMTVKKHVKGNNIYVECIISNFSFSDRGKNGPKKNGDGYIHLYLNGKKVDELHTAAFIIKGLPKGSHQVKIELVRNDGTSYGLTEEFDISVP